MTCQRSKGVQRLTDRNGCDFRQVTPSIATEGRSQRIEGAFLQDLTFPANGAVQVNHVITGLDEAAVHAAQEIRFKPVKRDGHPVDFPARERIEFRLAY
jgi:hypothetical protein